MGFLIDFLLVVFFALVAAYQYQREEKIEARAWLSDVEELERMYGDGPLEQDAIGEHEAREILELERSYGDEVK